MLASTPCHRNAAAQRVDQITHRGALYQHGAAELPRRRLYGWAQNGAHKATATFSGSSMRYELPAVPLQCAQRTPGCG
jgi:hypothetical protein